MDRLNIAHIGLLSPIKGVELFNKLSVDFSNINWYVIGTLELYGDMYNLDWSNTTITGYYKSYSELCDYVKLFNIDLVVSLSMCPETFSYTLSESIKLGLPVLGTELGAIGNRIKKLKCGWVVDVYNYESVKNAINYLNKNRDILKDRSNYIKTLKLKSIDEMKKEYNEIYKLCMK